MMDRLVARIVADRDLTSTDGQRWLLLSTVGFFTGVGLLCLVVSAFSSTFWRLNRREKVFWQLSLVRGVFGVFAAMSGFWATVNDLELHRDVVMAKSQVSYFMVLVAVGFFIVECTALFVSNAIFRYFDANLAVHHTLALLGYIAVLYYECNHFFAVVGLMLEMSTPSSALCWVLIKAKQANTTAWKANQMLLIHLFHCRSMVEMYIYYKSYLEWDRIWSTMPWVIFFLLYGQLSLIFFWLTPFWTYKKTWQLFNPIDWNHAKKQTTSNGSAPTGTIVEKDKTQ